MSSKRDDEDLERLLDARDLPDSGTDPLADLLRAAAAPDEPSPEQVLDGEEAAIAAFRTTLGSRPEKNTTPRRRPPWRACDLAGATAVLSAAGLLALAAIVLPRLGASDPQPSASLTPPTSQISPSLPNPGPSDTAALTLDNNVTLAAAAQNSPTSSTRTSAIPSAPRHGRDKKTPRGRCIHEHIAKARRN